MLEVKLIPCIFKSYYYQNLSKFIGEFAVHFPWITDCRLYVIDYIAKHRKECRSDSAVRKESMPQGRLKHISYSR